jgi:hypothetical protein
MVTIAAGALQPSESLSIALLGFDAVAFSSMGALLVRRRAGPSIGWLLALMGPALVATFSGFLFGALRTIEFGPDDPPAMVLSLMAGLLLYPTLGALALVALLFPDGRLPRGRALLAFGLLAGVLAAGLVMTAVKPGPVEVGLANNPLGIDDPLFAELGSVGLAIAPLALMLLIGLAVVVVGSRFRRARGITREQFRWFFAAAALLAVLLPVSFADSAFLGDDGFSVFDVLAVGSIALLPISIAVAVLRYRLYDLDTLINRTLVYGSLTAILAGVSAVTVGVLERLFRRAAGESSDLTIVVSTLIVVTAFAPVKARLQALVDRRFKEARDPTIALATFTTEVRNRIGPLDADRVLTRLLAVAAETCAAPGGTVVIRRAGTVRAVATTGEWGGASAVDALVTTADATVILSLAPRTGMWPSLPRDRAAIEAALVAVVTELGWDPVVAAPVAEPAAAGVAETPAPA